MLDEKRTKCLMGLAAAFSKNQGVPVDDAAVQKQLAGDDHAQAVYAKADGLYESRVAQNVPLAPEEGFLGQVGQFFQQFGFDPGKLFSWVRRPNALVGEENFRRVEAIFREHIETHGRNNKAAFIEEGKPEIVAISQEVLPRLSDRQRAYASEWFDWAAGGGELYNSPISNNPFVIHSQNAVRNLVTWNPAITLYNVFEVMPKSWVYATEKGASPGVMFKAWADYMGKTQGQPWRRIPELDRLGIYGKPLGKNFAGVSNLLDVTENFLRGYSYMLGEAIQPGAGAEALEKIAFIPRMANSPRALWNHNDAATLALMRFTISSNALYLQLLNNLRDPKTAGKAAVALAGFSVVQAMQTGGASAVPAPVWHLLPEDVQEGIQEFDKSVPGLNVVGQLTGSDFAETSRPLQPVGLGLGFTILQQDVFGGAGKIGRGARQIQEGDPAAGAARILEGFFGVGQLGTIPGVNMTTTRLIRSVAEQLEDYGNVDVVETGTRFLENTKLLNTEGL